jgi:hypothetical protein
LAVDVQPSARNILKNALNLKSSHQVTTFALVIGYNTSETLPTLKAGVSDVEEMSTLLRSYGFTVKTLINEQATRTNVRNLFSST